MTFFYKEHQDFRTKIHLCLKISQKILSVTIKYCMSYPLTAHKKPNCTTRFWHTSCMISLKGNRTPLLCILCQWSYPIILQQILASHLSTFHASLRGHGPQFKNPGSKTKPPSNKLTLSIRNNFVSR